MTHIASRHEQFLLVAPERGQACAVNKPSFAVLSLALAQLCSLLTRDWPSPS
jgi:hypothetical protein